MAHKTLIGGTAYSITAGKTLIGGTAYSITGGRTLIGGTGYNISFGTPLGNFSVGSSVYLNEAGSSVEYLIVHQGIPDAALYDASCNGTWLLRKLVYSQLQWDSAKTTDWSNSTLKAYLDSTFLERFDSKIQSTIKQVKIPYRAGGGVEGPINSGANGLQSKVFLLSGYEVGFSAVMFPTDGAKLDFFSNGDDAAAKAKRVHYRSDGTALPWWLRSPRQYSSSGDVLAVYNDGDYSEAKSNTVWGVVPALILPSNTPVPDSHLIA